MWISKHFIRHGTVHFLWLTSILLMVIVGLLIRLPDGIMVRDYLAFASSIASLILALVAIFYSVVSGQNFGESVSLLRSSADRLENESKSLQELIATLSGKSDLIISAVGSVSPSLDRLTEKLEGEGPQGQFDYGTSSAAKEADGGAVFFGKPTTIGAGVALYVIGKVSQRGKEFDLSKLSDVEVNLVQYVSGFISAVKMVRPAGVILSLIGNMFVVESLGSIDMSSLLAVLDGDDSDFVRDQKTKVDAVFTKLA